MGTVYFSGASIDENGKASGGKAGDQTGKEVLTRKVYTHSKGWRIFRHPDASVAAAIGSYAKAIADNNCFGYDQGQRATGYTASKAAGWNPAKVTTNVELDCSSMVRTCVACALKADVSDFNTASEASVLLKLGFTEITGTAVTDLVVGDICVTKTKGHTETVSSSTNSRAAASVSYYPTYTGSSTSIVTVLAAVGEKDTSFTHRKAIAVANGISGYTGTASQNLSMVTLCKKGKLIKA